MSEQDDLFNEPKRESDEELVSTETAGSEENASTDGESEIVDDIAGSGIAGGEVRVVKIPPRRGSSGRLWLAMLLLVVLFGAGYYLLTGGFHQPSPEEISTQRQPMPKRYPVDQQVEVEVLEQRQVVAEPVAEPDKRLSIVETKPAVSIVEEQNVAEPAVPLYRVLVGPFLSSSAVEKAKAQLLELGFAAQTTKGRGLVTMTRLLVGVYPAAEVRAQLAEIKKQVDDAFMLPNGEQRAIYVGSFQDSERAAEYAKTLAHKGIHVTLMPSDIEMNGKMLVALQADQDTARQVATQIGKFGLKTQVVRK